MKKTDLALYNLQLMIRQEPNKIKPILSNYCLFLAFGIFRKKNFFFIM